MAHLIIEIENGYMAADFCKDFIETVYSHAASGDLYIDSSNGNGNFQFDSVQHPGDAVISITVVDEGEEA